MLIATFLIQFSFIDKVFCIPSEGNVVVETVHFASCDVLGTQNKRANEIEKQIPNGHKETCKDCTDISINKPFLLTRTISHQIDHTFLNPTEVTLYASTYTSYISYESIEETIPLQSRAFTYHPNRILKSVILII